MKATRFTDTFLAGLKPARNHYKVRDKSEAVGFGIQVARGGTKTFFVALSIDGKQTYIGLARYVPPVTRDGKRIDSNLAAQRDRARHLRTLRDGGINPVRWLKEEADERRVGSFGDLLDRYLAKLGERPSAEHAKRIFDHDIRPYIDEAMPARDVTSGMISSALAKIHERGATTQANRAHSYVSAAFGFGLLYDNDPKAGDRTVRFGLLANPVRAIQSYQRDEAAVDRVLSAKELRAFWQALDENEAMQPDTARFLRLLVITGQRASQWRQATWSEFDIDAGVWVVPGEHMKARNPAKRRPHAVPLHPMALDLVCEQRAFRGTDRLFPGARDPDEPIDIGTPNEAIRRLCKRRGFKPFNARDLRRTWKTRTGDVGISRADRDLVQGHGVARDVASEHYDRSLYLPEKRRAMDAWCDYLQALVTDANVTAIRRA